MKSSGRVTTASPPAMPAPYPSGASGDWRTFSVGVLLIAVFLGAFAFSPIGPTFVPGATAMQDLATRPTPPMETLGEVMARQERYTPTNQSLGGKRVVAEAETAADL